MKKTQLQSALDVLVLAAYLVITAVVVLHHEPWSDEANPWLIARDAPPVTFVHFLLNNYDRHPALWYLILFPFAKAGLPYLTLSVIHYVIAAAAALIFYLKAPFSRITKILWLSSYYMMYEYIVIARNYAVTVLLIFSIAALYAKRHKHPVFFSLLIALLFNASYLCLFLASGLGFVFIWEWLETKEKRPAGYLSVLILVIGGVAVMLQGAVLPADHINYAYHPDPNYGKILQSLVTGFVPFNTDISAEFGGVLTWSVLGLSVLVLITKPIPLVLLVFSYLWPLYIYVFAHPGDRRHYGFFLVFLFFILWISESYAPRFKRLAEMLPSKILRPLTVGIICFCLLVNVRASYAVQRLDYSHPFSASKEMARFINELFERFGLDDGQHVVVGSRHSTTASLLPYMPERKFWYAYLNDYGTYYVNRKSLLQDATLAHDEVISRAEESFGDLSKVLFLFSYRPVRFKASDRYEFRLIMSADQNVVGYTYEKYYLYKPIPKAPLPTPR